MKLQHSGTEAPPLVSISTCLIQGTNKRDDKEKYNIAVEFGRNILTEIDCLHATEEDQKEHLGGRNHLKKTSSRNNQQ